MNWKWIENELIHFQMNDELNDSLFFKMNGELNAFTVFRNELRMWMHSPKLMNGHNLCLSDFLEKLNHPNAHSNDVRYV